MVRDRFRFQVPPHYHGELSPRIGLYVGSHRAQAEVMNENGPAAPGAARVDDEGRIVLPPIRIH